MADHSLLKIDSKILNEALALADASFRERNSEVRKRLEERAMNLWAAAHQGRRDVIYARGC